MIYTNIREKQIHFDRHLLSVYHSDIQNLLVFSSQDPLNPQELNSYSEVLNDVIKVLEVVMRIKVSEEHIFKAKADIIIADCDALIRDISTNRKAKFVNVLH